MDFYYYIDQFVRGTISASIVIFAFGVIFMLTERIRPHKGTSIFGKDFSKELWLALLNGSFFSPLFTIILTFFFIEIAKIGLPRQMFAQHIAQMPLPLQVLAGAFIMDFSTYWRHRLMHAWFWPFHSIHHSAEELTWITALRLHPFEMLMARLFDVTLLHLLGFDESDIVGATLFAMFYNFFAHTNINLEFGAPLRYIFASPNYHRWHHANDKAAYDKNFCAMFSLLDVMFGTYYHPAGTLPDAYGLSPREQKEVPKNLWPHLLYPFKKFLHRSAKK